MTKSTAPMHRVALLGVAAFVTVLAGCATAPEPEKVWVGGAGNFEMDKGQCQAQAFGASTMSALQIALIYNSCMRGKGWQQVAK